MAAYVCPNKHDSSDADYCSVCGAKIEPAAIRHCPDCSAERVPEDLTFCEMCGYNFVTGARGQLREAASAVAPWTLVVTVDPSLRDSASPEPPADFTPLTIELTNPVSLIGRKSASRSITPEISLDFDDAVSHRHALLEVKSGGALSIRDIGSANGTRVNGADVAPMIDRALSDGDQITLGHWTRIGVKERQ